MLFRKLWKKLKDYNIGYINIKSSEDHVLSLTSLLFYNEILVYNISFNLLRYAIISW